MPLISVIVPVYKVERYLQRCVDSILAQSFDDFELILVDDGSPDNCGKICDDYAKKDPRIHVIHQANGGLSAARNAGIDWSFTGSNSEWITFIDSDDWVHHKYLEFLHRAVKETKSRISVCRFTETDGLVYDQNAVFSADIMDWDRLLIDDNVLAVIGCGKLYSKDLFSALRYPQGKIHEDEFLTYKLLAQAGIIACVPEQLYYYFNNSEGITGKGFSLKRLDALDAFEERIEFVLPLGKKELVGFCVASFVNKCRSLTDELNNADWIDTDIRIGKKLELRSRARKILARYGIRYVPVKKYTESYDFAFPVFTNILRFFYRIIGKR